MLLAFSAKTSKWPAANVLDTNTRSALQASAGTCRGFFRLGRASGYDRAAMPLCSASDCASQDYGSDLAWVCNRMRNLSLGGPVPAEAL